MIRLNTTFIGFHSLFCHNRTIDVCTTDCGIHYGEEITTMGLQGQRPLAPTLFATRSGYNKEATTSFSLSHTLYDYSSQKYQQQHIMKMCALSHIYTYMTFGLFTQMSTPIGRTDRNRLWNQPVLSIFHPEGHVSQQTLPSLRHGMSL